MKFQQAMKLFCLLTEEGKISKNKETLDVFNSYFDTDVKKYLDVITSEMGLYTFIQSETIYMYAESTSPFSMSNSEMKSKILGVQTNMQLYLVEIIFLIFIKEIFSGENQMEQQRNFISLGDLVIEIDNVFEQIAMDEDIDEKTGINFYGAFKIWRNLTIDTEGEKLSSKTRMGFVINSINFFVNEGLIEKRNDTGDYLLAPSIKLKNFIAAGKFDIDKFNSTINSIGEEKTCLN